MDTLAASHDGMALSDLAELTDLPVSTAHRLLTTLESHRYVRFEADQSLWQVGVQAFVVGNSFARSRNLVALARPLLRRLVNELGETASLYLEDQGEATCMAQFESPQMMRAIARPGGRVKLHCSGVGKAILAFCADAEVSKVLKVHGLPRLTEKTLDTPAKLRADLAVVRRRGYAVDDEEHAVGLRCVAAPIFDEQRAAVAGISVSAPVTRLTTERIEAFGRNVQEIADHITQNFAGDRFHTNYLDAVSG